MENGAHPELPSQNGAQPPANIHEDAVRRTILEFSRVSEQTAILASFLRGYMLHTGQSKPDQAGGVAGGYEKTARQKLTKQFIDALDASLGVSGVRGSLEVVDLRWRGYEDTKSAAPSIELTQPGLEDLWKTPRAHLSCGASANGHNDGLPRLELAALPVDGLKPLLDGRAGASVVALAATSDRFQIERWQSQPTSYARHLVLVLRPGTRLDLSDHADANGILKHWSAVPQAWHENACVSKLVEDLWGRVRRSDHLPPRIETIDIRDTLFGCRPILKKQCQIHDFPGSSVAAALSVGIAEHGADAFIGIVRGASVAMVAAAALATGSQFLAIELAWAKTSRPTESSVDIENRPEELEEVKKAKPKENWILVIPEHARLLEAKNFLPNDHFAFIVTSITSHRGLRGIRQTGSNFETETLIYNAHYSSLRVLRHRRDIGRDMFYGEGGARIRALDAIQAFCQPEPRPAGGRGR